jgi:hypothetical protein
LTRRGGGGKFDADARGLFVDDVGCFASLRRIRVLHSLAVSVGPNMKLAIGTWAGRILFQAGLLAAVPAALAQAGVSEASASTAPGAPAEMSAAPVARLTVEQLMRLKKVIQDKGTSIPVPAPVVQLLGLSAQQVVPVVRQASFQEDGGVKHGFALLNDGAGYFLFRRTADKGLTVFRVDGDFRLIAAGHNFVGDRFLALDDAQARSQLQEEIVAWSRVLSPRGAAMPLPGLPGSPPLRPEAAAPH